MSEASKPHSVHDAMNAQNAANFAAETRRANKAEADLAAARLAIGDLEEQLETTQRILGEERRWRDELGEARLADRDLIDSLRAERNGLKEQHEALTQDRDAALSQVDELDEKVRGLSEQLEAYRAAFDKLDHAIGDLDDFAENLSYGLKASSPASRSDEIDWPMTRIEALDANTESQPK